MSSIITLALKDLKLIIRNRAGLFWIFFFPLLLALFFGMTFGGQSSRNRALPVAVVDLDQSTGSKKLIDRLVASNAIKPTPTTMDEARDMVRKGDQVAFLVIPKGFGNADLFFSPDRPTLEVGMDPSRQAEAGYLQGLLTEAQFKGMQDLFTDKKKLEENFQKGLKQLEKAKDLKPAQRDLLKKFFSEMNNFFQQMDPQMMNDGRGFQPGQVKMVSITRDTRARPRSSFEITFPSSVLWGILSCVLTFIISIVMERVNGTFLRIRFSPMTWTQILGGKALACFTTCIAVSLVMLIIGRVIFGVRLEHPIQLALAVISLSICFVGIQMLLATLGKTVEGVAGAAWGILMPMAMIGGAMVPLIAMPEWMLQISSLSPVKWGIIALEGAIWRDYSLSEMLMPCGILIGIGLVAFTIGVKKLSLER